jgi:hypothetical protein
MAAGSPSYSQFKAISDQVKANTLTKDAAINQLSSINFNQFLLQEIRSLVAPGFWLPPSVAVPIVREWVATQDERLLEIRAWLFANPKPLAKATLDQFIDGLRNPSSPLNIIVKDIVGQLATNGGTVPYVNPYTAGLIGVTETPAAEDPGTKEKLKDDLTKFFDKDSRSVLLGPSKKDSALRITLPPFLVAQLTGYEFEYNPKGDGATPPVAGSLKSWELCGILDDGRAEVIDIQDDNNEFKDALDKTHEFKITKPSGFFRTFELKITGPDHQNSMSFHLTGFRLNGLLKLTAT